MTGKSITQKNLGLVFLLIFLTACNAEISEEGLIFQSLLQSDSENYSAYQENNPAIRIASSSSEIPDLGSLVSIDAQTQLISLNYRTRFAIAVFQGRKGSSGYGVQIERIVRDGGVVYVFAQFINPELGREVQTVETSPYDLVRVRKTGEWNQDITFNLIVDGAVAASTTHFIP